MISLINIYVIDMVWILSDFMPGGQRVIWFCKASLRISHLSLFECKGPWILKTDSLKLVSAIFYQFLIFARNDSPSKTSFLRRFVQFFVIFFIPVHTFQTQKNNGVELFTMSWTDLHKFADVIFGITQKALYYIFKLGQVIYS